MKEPKEFESLVDIDYLIDEYERTSGFRLIIRKSNNRSRTYHCGSHVGCCFRARFGTKRGTEKIILKGTMTKLTHNGKNAPATANGRAHKKRLKGRFDDVVSHLTEVKDAKPVPKDVMKAVAA